MPPLVNINLYRSYAGYFIQDNRGLWLLPDGMWYLATDLPTATQIKFAQRFFQDRIKAITLLQQLRLSFNDWTY